MWGYAVIGLMFFSIFYIYYENKQRSIFIKYSKKIILSSSEILTENFTLEKVQNSTNIYLLNKNEKLLKALIKDVNDIKLNELIFSDFQIFRDYIDNTKPSIKIFTHMKTLYLFYPILNENNAFQFVVFEKNKIILDDLIGFKTNKYNH